MRHGSKESFCSYKMWFDVLPAHLTTSCRFRNSLLRPVLSIFRVHSSSISFSNSITAYMLNAGAALDEIHCVSVIAVSVSNVPNKAYLNGALHQLHASYIHNI